MVWGAATAFLALLGCSVGLGELLEVVERPDGSTRVDSSITSWMVSQRSEPVTTLAKVLTTLGSQAVLTPVVLVVVLVLLWRRRWVVGAFLAVVWAGAIGLYDLVKHLVGRPRPPADIWLVKASGSSFPSGHATQSLATFTALALVAALVRARERWPAVTLAVTLAAGVAWSRVYLGVHWATDVGAGCLMAAAWVAVVWWLAGQALRVEAAPRATPTAADRQKVAGGDVGVEPALKTSRSQSWRRRVPVLLLGAALVAAAWASGFYSRASNNSPGTRAKGLFAVDPEPFHILASGFQCGHGDEWAIKTLSDPDASKVNFTPKSTTVDKLVSIATPGDFTVPRTDPAHAKVELQTWNLDGVILEQYRVEPDSDVHLELKSADSSSTMIAEIPDPNCVSSSFKRTEIAQARANLIAEVGSPIDEYQTVNKPVDITGVGFLDFKHDQTGVAQNGAELHPVLSFKLLP